MMMYLDRHGITHMELNLDEITDLQSCLLQGTRVHTDKRRPMHSMYARISKLVYHLLTQGEQDVWPAREQRQIDLPGITPPQPQAPNMMDPGSPVDSPAVG